MTDVRCSNADGVARGRLCNHLLFKTDGMSLQIMCPKCGALVHFGISELQYRAILEAAGIANPDLEGMPDVQVADVDAGEKPASGPAKVGRYGQFKPKTE